MTPLYDLKGADLAETVEAEVAFKGWSLPAEDAPEIHAKKLEEAWSAAGEDPDLLAVFWSVYGTRFLWSAVLKVFGFTSVACTPLLIKVFLGQLQLQTAVSTSDEEEPWALWMLYLLVPAMTMSSFLYTFVWHHYMLYNIRIGMCMRSGVLMLIYKKALRLTAQQLASSSNNEVNNLVTSDAERITQGLTFAHFLWGSPVEIIIGVTLAYVEIGWPAFVALGVLLLQTPLLNRFGETIAGYRSAVATQTDERVRTMNEVLGGQQTIKLYGWEQPLLERVAAIRAQEISLLWKMQMTMGVSRSVSQCCTLVCSLVAFGCYELAGNHLTLKTAFACLAYFRQMELALVMLPLAIDGRAQMTVATGRVQEFRRPATLARRRCCRMTGLRRSCVGRVSRGRLRTRR